ncbi:MULTISPECIES: hypothetical protein [unclassified Variovorax]|uniref:hypothetical protein n=2 Tax=Variovorax TaxID=34072 RepID=UPI000AF1AEAE|nr:MULTISPECIES: hypothetical protein [unclassified Variovorax]VTV17846.1 Cobalt-zinc-cadmium resistance protein CzcI [Variovorax sp. WDL1]
MLLGGRCARLRRLFNAAARRRTFLCILWKVGLSASQYGLASPKHVRPMLEFMNNLRGAGGLSAMRRFLFVLLLAVVPLQFAWSAASGYCRHEAGTGAAHFGHHDHKASALSVEKAHDLKLKQIADGDDNCIGCHINVVLQIVDRVPPVIAAGALRPPDSRPHHYRSPTPPGLERPARRLAI